MSRQDNGDGSVYKTIQKVKRKKFLDKVCLICATCTEKCDRENFGKCEKCKNCKECLKYCDRYYCAEKWIAQVTINGKQKTIATAKTKREAKEKKKIIEAKLLTDTYITKNSVYILDLIKNVDQEKLKSGNIKQSTHNRNQYQYKKIEQSKINNIPVQKISYQQIQDFLNIQRNSSQSEIDRLVQKLKLGFEEAIKKKIINYADNPMLRIQSPISCQNTKIRIPLSLEEEIRFLKYLAVQDVIVKSNKCNYTNNTVRNLLIIAFLSGCRIGELSSINYAKHIDFNNKYIIIERTATEDENERKILGTTTKTGNKKKKKHKKDIHYIPFGIFDEDVLTYILKNQIYEAKSILNNKNELLFCNKNGNIIDHIGINNIFKRICKVLNIYYDDNTESLSLHSTRHTAITRMVEMGMDLKVIASIAGHSNTRQIEETYGHILYEFQMKQITNPGSYYTKKDIITPELKDFLLKIYN